MYCTLGIFGHIKEESIAGEEMVVGLSFALQEGREKPYWTVLMALRRTVHSFTAMKEHENQTFIMDYEFINESEAIEE